MTPRFQRNTICEDGGNLIFDLILCEDWIGVFIQLNDPGVPRRYNVHEFFDIVIDVFVVYQDFADIRCEIVPNGPNGQMTLLVKKTWGGAGNPPFFDISPQPKEITNVFGDFALLL